jgi:gas vesicle protein
MNGGISMTTGTTRSGFWQGIFIGGAIATVSSLLFAPKAGKHLRKQLTYLFSSNTQVPSTHAPVNQTINSMAQNEQEMAKLGEEMKHMDTNTQVKNKGMIPDPIQNE